MVKIIQYIIVGICVSFFFFPVGFYFLPQSVNTKIILSVIGCLFLVFDYLNRDGQIVISRQLFFAFLISVIFSLVCFFSADYNEVIDYSYATHFASLLIWLTSGYSVCKLIKIVHGEVNLRQITYYLAAVCVTQCFLALLIDRIPVFQVFVDSIFRQGQEFFQEVDRLYGIGAALDSAGVRFSIVLPMIASVVMKDKYILTQRRLLILFVLAYIIIVVVGNAISRTTLVGAALGFLILIINSRLWTFIIESKYFSFFKILIVLVTISMISTIYLYNTDISFYRNMRFAFEGFFKWYETGTWETGSTNKLNSEMWVWPDNTKDWIIGTGRFGSFVYGTDIGYCRFILYCGLIGFSIFSFFFIYLALSFAKENYRYADLFIAFLLLTFIIWIKVSTDIFLIYALLFSIDLVNQTYSNKVTHENSLLYS